MKVLCWFFVAGMLLPYDLAGFAMHSKAAGQELNPAAQAKVQAAYARLPLAFEPNRGQADKKVKFLSRGSAYSLFLSSTEAVFQWQHGFRKEKLETSLARAKRSESIPGTQQSKASPSGIDNPELVTLSLKLAGANQAPQMEGLDPLRGKSHYFTGNDTRQWHADVPTYAKVRYRSVYPGIDVVYYGNQQQLEYDFIIAPGGDPKRIVLSFEGATNTRGGVCLRLDDNGDLLIRAGEAELRQFKPVVYQESDGIRRTIAGRYVLKGRRQAGFELGDYDHSKPLVVDPVISYFSTGLGEGGGRIAFDPAGNAYLTGTNVTCRPNRFSNYNPCLDAFVAKLDPSGTEVLYRTYLGGSRSDSGADIAIDEAGYIYVTGQTSSADFPTTPGAFQSIYLGGTCKNLGVTPTTRPCEDLFIAKLNPTGTELIYSTYLGGSSSEYASGIALDVLGNAYVTGATRSTNFPTTQGSFQIIPGSGACSDAELCTSDAFVVKLNSSGTELLYSTYLGGVGFDWCSGIAVDSDGNAHVAGGTYSDDFPTTPGAFQVGNSFVSKLNATGTAVLYSTRFGSALDAAQNVLAGTTTAIALDLDGNAYLTGYTSSSDFPTTPGAFQSVCNSNGSNYFDLADAFVTKLNTTGTEIVYSTCLGGRNFEDGVAISVDSAGNAYVAGRTASADFPTTEGADHAGSEVETWGGAFVTKLNSTGSALVYSTYLGDQLWASDIGVDSVGDAYVSGERSDSTGSHPFVTKLHDDLSSLAPLNRLLEQRKHHLQVDSDQPRLKTQP